MFRVDIFKHKKTNKFYTVPIYTMDFALKVLPNKAVVQGKDKKSGLIKDWILMDENYEFCFSLYKDSLILIQTKDMQEPELVYYERLNNSNASLTVSKHDNKFETLSKNQKILFKNANEKEVIAKSIGIQNLKVFEKYIVSVLGEVTKAEFRQRENFKKMSYDEAFKTLLISSNAKLNLELNHLVIKQDENIAKLFLKDINIIVLESLQASLGSALFNAFAKHKIILLTCDETHSINGVFTPFLGYFQSAKIAKEQMNVSAQKRLFYGKKSLKIKS